MLRNGQRLEKREGVAANGKEKISLASQNSSYGTMSITGESGEDPRVTFCKEFGAGNFSGALELFYPEFPRQSIENKHVKSGLGLALLGQVGEASRGSL